MVASLGWRPFIVAVHMQALVAIFGSLHDGVKVKSTLEVLSLWRDGAMFIYLYVLCMMDCCLDTPGSKCVRPCHTLHTL